MTTYEIKKFVKEHKTELIVGGVALVLGVKVGRKVAARDFKKKDVINRLTPKPFRDDVRELFTKSKRGVSFVIEEPGRTVQELLDTVIENHDPCLEDKCKGLLVFL